jgi:hypothetical protein
MTYSFAVQHAPQTMALSHGRATMGACMLHQFASAVHCQTKSSATCSAFDRDVHVFTERIGAVSVASRR